MPPQASDNSVFNLARELWRRRKWHAVFVFTLVMAGVAGVAVAMPDIYRATARILVDQSSVQESFVRSSVSGELDARLQAVSQEVMSRSRLEELIQQFNLYPELRKRVAAESVLKRMRRDIRLDRRRAELQWGRGATIAFTLSYQGWDPRKVSEITNLLATSYVEENDRIRQRQATATTKFLRQQLQKTEQELERQDRKINEFRKLHMGELPEQQGAMQSTLERLNAQLGLNNENQIRVMERRERLLEQFAEAGMPYGGEETDATAARLVRLRKELAELRVQFTDKYPDIVRIKSEIERLESQLQDRTASGNNADSLPPFMREQLREQDDRLAALKTEERELRETINTYQTRMENVPKREQELQALQQEYNATKDQHTSLLERFEEAELAETLETRNGSQFRIIEPAIQPEEPAGPNRIGILFMGFVLACCAAVGAMFITDKLDTSFHSISELQAFTRIVILADIPNIITAGDKWKHRFRSGAVALSAAVLVVLIARLSYFIGDGNEQLVWLLTRAGP